jgi:hypothetical protein
VSRHVLRYEGKRRPVWRAKYRLPHGHQVQETIEPAWNARCRPPAGYFTRRTAEAWLRRVLADATAGTLSGMVRTGATVADACAEDLRYVEQDRQRKPSTLRDYASIFRNYVLPHLGDVALENLTAERIERWAAIEIDPDRRLANRNREKAITVFHGVMERARKLYRLPTNPVADVEKPRTASRTEINVFSPEEVMALLRAADSEQDAAIYLTAAFTGLPPGRADRAALARRRLRRLGDPRPRELHERPPHDAEVRQSPLRPDGGEGRGGPRSWASASTSPQKTAPTSRTATAPLPRPLPHVRHEGHRRRGHPPRPGVDGPRERPDDDAVPPLRPAPAGRRARRTSLRVIADTAGARLRGFRAGLSPLVGVEVSYYDSRSTSTRRHASTASPTRTSNTP